MIPHQWLPPVLTGLLLVPAGAVVAVGLTRWRRARGLPTGTAWRLSIADAGLVVGTVPWIWMILTPLPGPREVHPVPLLDVWGVLQDGPGFAFVQIAGNLLVFAAFGLFAPLRWRLGPWAVTLIAAVASVTVEILQYVLDLGRVSATDDVLLNAAGAGLAALAGRALVRSAREGTAPVR